MKKAEEERSLAAIEKEEKKWAALIELSEAAHAKAEKMVEDAKEKQEKALKRKADLTVQAERRVQQETIANAAKRGEFALTPSRCRTRNAPTRHAYATPRVACRHRCARRCG